MDWPEDDKHQSDRDRWYRLHLSHQTDADRFLWLSRQLTGIGHVEMARLSQRWAEEHQTISQTLYRMAR